MMGRIGTPVIPIFALATLVTGTVLSLAVIVAAVALSGEWLQQAAAQASAPAGNGSTAGLPAWLLVVGSGFHLLLLWVATTISVDKPWGKTTLGRRALPGRRRHRIS